MLKDMDFEFYGKGIDGYMHYSLATNRIREEESSKALLNEFDKSMDECDADTFDAEDFGGSDF